MKANKNDNENSSSTLGTVLSTWVYLLTHRYWTTNAEGERVLCTHKFTCDLHTAREYVRAHLGYLVNPMGHQLIHAYNTLRQLDWPELQTNVRADENRAWAWWFTEHNAAWDFTAGLSVHRWVMDLIDYDKKAGVPQMQAWVESILQNGRNRDLWMYQGAQTLLWWLYGIPGTFAILQTQGLGGWMAGMVPEEHLTVGHLPVYLAVNCPDEGTWKGMNSPSYYEEYGGAQTSSLTVTPVADPHKDTSWMLPPEEVMTHPWRKRG